jgi:hypothetical protein
VNVAGERGVPPLGLAQQLPTLDRQRALSPDCIGGINMAFHEVMNTARSDQLLASLSQRTESAQS